MLTVPDTTTGLKAEFIAAVDKIYRQICNLQVGTKVLIITDSRTPRHVVTVFMGMAMAMGAEVSVSENVIASSPADQPAFKWNPMVVAAAREADLIVDMAVGYAPFMAEAVERGAQIMSPGDGTGGHHIEDSLIRTVLQADLDSLRREAIHVANLFTRASELRMTSEEGSDFTLNIAGYDGIASHEFLWDYEKGTKILDWSALPPSAPGIVLPKYAGDGVIAVDGFVLYADLHEFPGSPVFMTFKKGRVVDIKGNDRLLVARLSRWLDGIAGDTGRFGPVHFNLGLNPKARLNEHPEFERVRGAVTLGMGDSSLMTRMWSRQPIETVTSDVHWDFVVMRPTIALDGKVICDRGVVPPFETQTRRG
jgi:2,5-dihydroxypyridine 5,6-dioxygenase